MFIICVYDIKEERVNRVYKVLRKYLYWRQRSVFDGEIDKKLLEKMIEELKNTIKKKEDFIIIYQLRKKPDKIINLGKQINRENEITYNLYQI